MKKTILVALLLIPFFAFSQKFVTHKNVVADGYNFWVCTPADYDAKSDPKPVVLFLHGSSLCGSDLDRVRRYGTLDAISKGRKIDAVVIAPQNPGGSWRPSKIMNVVNWVTKHYTTDTNRLYVLGMSLGGYGTIDFVGTYPEKVAAAIALCGGGTLSNYCGLSQVPLWIMHGTADRAIGLSESQKVVDAIKACGDASLLRFTKLAGQNHSQLARVFYLEEAYQWLFAHNLADRTIHNDVDITVATLSKAYQNVEHTNVTVENAVTQTVTDSTTAATVEVVKTEPAPQTEVKKATTTSTVKYHTVKKGDTLGAIARKYHTTVSKLCKLNKIKETTILQIGKKLRVK